MNAEVDALVAQWRDEWELVRLKDVPAWTTHRAHLDKFVEQLDELREALAARPAAPPVGEAERLREALTWVRVGLDELRPRVSSHDEHLSTCNGDEDTPCDCGSFAPSERVEALLMQIDAALASPAPQPAAPAPVACPNCGGMGETTHDILAGGTEHDTEQRECDVCKGTGLAAPAPAVGECPDCGPVNGCDEDGCCKACGHDVEFYDDALFIAGAVTGESGGLPPKKKSAPAVGEAERLREALVKVRAHTSYVVLPEPQMGNLLRGLLASIERITDAALAPRAPEPAAPVEPPPADARRKAQE